MFKKRQWYLSMLTEISSWPWTKFFEMIDAIRTDTMSLKGPKSLMRNSETSRNLRGPEWLQKKLSVSDQNAGSLTTTTHPQGSTHHMGCTNI